ncbi:interleukin-1 beta [Cottoperca gobio]|uniref:Interleukin-1 n=1 Tax=Cottoperca gobio TaxID=56716 RepID=A0A6J2QCS5_COTGO|nr:interleukin-1 beta [Cottoperca gobio]
MDSEMNCDVSQMWSPNTSSGLDFEITHHPLTMRNVVNLIVAMERMKGSSSESVLSTEFRDEQLLNVIMDSIVEEQIMYECESAPPVQIRWTGEEQQSVTDSEKRSLVLVENSMELHAVTLQGGAEPRKVFLNMSTFLHPASTIEGRTVALGIKGKNLYLSCHMNGAEPTLHLEAVEDRSLLSINLDSNMVRFLFYKQDTGVNISTLMSVAFPDWYISTAEQTNKPVEMCQQSASRYQTFNISDIPEDVKH